MARVNREYRIVDAASAGYASSIRVRTRFRLEIETLDAEANRQLSCELTKLSQECGCKRGALFLMMSVLLSAVVSIIFWKAWWPHPILWLMIASSACFVTAGIGKAIGIYRARSELRARLLSLSQQLERRMEATPHGMHR